MKYQLLDREKIDNPSTKIYVSKIENRITLKIEAEYYLELLTLDAMKLLGSNKSKITEDQNGENVSHLKITEEVLVHCNIFNKDYHTEEVLVHCNIFNNDYQQDS